MLSNYKYVHIIHILYKVPSKILNDMLFSLKLARGRLNFGNNNVIIIFTNISLKYFNSTLIFVQVCKADIMMVLI